MVVPVLLLLASLPAMAQRPMADSAQAARAAAAVTELIRASQSPAGLQSDDLLRHTDGPFRQKMIQALGDHPFQPGPEYRVHSVTSIRSDDSVAVVAVTAIVDTLPHFGPVAAELTFFTILDSTGWRVVQMRRFAQFESRIGYIREVDSSTAYPSSLKPAIIREYSSVLLSNVQLRENFASNRTRFAGLVDLFYGSDSLTLLGRIDHNASQLNRMALEWGPAAQTIPQEAIDEYLASADSKERAEFRAAMKHVDKLYRQGRDSLAQYARKYGVELARVDSAIALMYDLRINFINARLPWKRAVQLSVGGNVDDAIGYLYSPEGELPTVSSEDYYYLEELGDGWWIFRAG